MTHLNVVKGEDFPASGGQSAAQDIRLPTAQDVGVHHFWLGDTVVTALSDGWADASLDFVDDPDRAKLEAMEHAAFRRPVPRLQLQAWLVRSPGRKPVLIDTGPARSGRRPWGSCPAR